MFKNKPTTPLNVNEGNQISVKLKFNQFDNN